jgi:hypothetical protein
MLSFFLNTFIWTGRAMGWGGFLWGLNFGDRIFWFTFYSTVLHSHDKKEKI